MDWQDSLKSFLENNPDLPRGEEESLADLPAAKRSRGRLDVLLDKKGRAGKTATIVAGFADDEPDDEIERLARLLKKRLGVGGSARGGEILIQGDRRKDVAAILENEGYKSRFDNKC